MSQACFEEGKESGRRKSVVGNRLDIREKSGCCGVSMVTPLSDTHTHTHGEPENSLTTVYTVCVWGGGGGWGGLGQGFFHQPEVVPVPVSERRPTESHVDVRSVIGQTRCS